jgi:hypothetical protein
MPKKKEPLTKSDRMGQVHQTCLANKGGFADKWDIFASPIPNFNIENQTHIGSSLGVLASFILVTSVLAYSVVKFIHLMEKHNP